ncbi:vitamin B12 ABC transporter substrate-binding protein BtuF [Photobacterium sp. GJ3]|uniref:vitamin B12 ABC transporter substrate-binding protein BtuF n=1 Tax=Photobacterium sp. GJ3 TaxID=2829502 RepID=UPI002012E27B|nr:vitamin B12 ABC transporter substrate-binding protein BtuF [Photobacterium sp. GJ3]
MKPVRALLLLLCLASTLAQATSAKPQRIISLAPHTTELAYAAGLGDKLVAASDYSDYPPAALALERVANHRGIKLERILALKPDLILAWQGGNPPREMAKLTQLGIEIFYSHPTSLDAIADSLDALGQFADDPVVARKAAADFRQTQSRLAAAYGQKSPVRFFYQLGHSPLMSMSGDSWPSQVFSLCGGQNIFADSPVAYPQISREQVLIRQPQALFATFGHGGPDQSVFNLWQPWQEQLPAVKHQHLYQVQADWLNRPTPRALKAAEIICKQLDEVRKQTSK